MFDTLKDAADALRVRIDQFTAAVQDRDPGATVAHARTGPHSLDMMVTNSDGGRDVYAFEIHQEMEIDGKFYIDCQRVINVNQ